MTKKYKASKEELINEYMKLLPKYSKISGLSTIGRTWWRENTKYTDIDVVSAFGSYSKFKEEAIKRSGVTKRQDTDVIKENKSKNTVYFVTSVVEGSEIDSGFYKSIETFCNETGAKRLFLWTRGVSKLDIMSPNHFDMFGADLVTEFTFNENLKAKDFMLHPSQMLPLTGLGRFGNKECSLIVASTKQHMTSVPRAKNLQPHVLWSTGTLSIPRYSSTRAGSFAAQDNTIGGLIVEVKNSKKFNIRPVQYKDNGFIDLGVKYCYNGNVERGISAEAIVWGDLHLTDEDSTAVKVSIEQTKLLKSKRVFLHDVCSWNSVNRHDMNNYLISESVNLQTLEEDYTYTAKGLTRIINKVNTGKSKTDFYIVKSNHDLWIKKWVQAGDFVKDKLNSLYGANAFIDFYYGRDPIEKEVTKRMSDGVSKYLHFMKQEESMKVAGYELGQHGENGANGSRGTIKGLGRSHDKIVVGHSHSPNIFYSAIQVGTNSKLQLPYAVGDSSWMHANCVIYPNGTYQLITFIDGEWKL